MPYSILTTDFIALCYVAIMVLSVFWLVYRAWLYMREQKERDRSLAAAMLSDEKFKEYLAGVKQEKTAKSESAERADTDSTRSSG